MRKRPWRGLTRDNGTAIRVTMNTSNGKDRRHCNSVWERMSSLPSSELVVIASRSVTSSLTSGFGSNTPYSSYLIAR
ncbi:hypothetical protein D3C87_1887270 [compost metagenome]